MTPRLRLLVAGISVVAVACSSGDSSGNGVSSDGETPARSVEQIESTSPEGTPSALVNPDSDEFPEPLVELDEIRSGGPPPDGIPPIDDPRFLDAADVDFLADDEPVLALEIDGDARAYPIQIMTWHEIVNDTVGGVPVTLSYCPLCNSAVAYDRRLGDRILDFGTSGSLYRSALVMYDRQTESLWSHFTGQAIVGALAGEEVEVLPASIVSWADWRNAHPDSLVLSRDTGHNRDYGRNPYPGYDSLDDPPFGYEGEVDGRFAAKERILGIGDDEASTAILLTDLFGRRVITTDLDGREIAAWLKPGTASALEAGEIADGRDVGATGVFETTVDGQRLTFGAVDDDFVDAETGSTWNVLGEATAGPLAGAQLTPVQHVDTFWFAWAAFRPDTEIVEPN